MTLRVSRFKRIEVEYDEEHTITVVISLMDGIEGIRVSPKMSEHYDALSSAYGDVWNLPEGSDERAEAFGRIDGDKLAGAMNGLIEIVSGYIHDVIGLDWEGADGKVIPWCEMSENDKGWFLRTKPHAFMTLTTAILGRDEVPSEKKASEPDIQSGPVALVHSR